MTGASITVTSYISDIKGGYQSSPPRYTRGTWGKLGAQLQHGTLQEIWGDSWWEEIVLGPRQGGGDPVTPPTQRWTNQEQHQRDAQWVDQYQNKTTPLCL
jgi:hypothetical protein